MSSHSTETGQALCLRPLLVEKRVAPGDDLAALLQGAAQREGIELSRGIVIVCQKVISKAEGRIVQLASVEPRPEALEIAQAHDKDPRQVEVVLQETKRIVRRGHGVLICETHHGFVCANAGVDLSNAPSEDSAVLLPVDPDASARRLLMDLEKAGSTQIGVIITDTFGRPWREGLVDQAIGCAGLAPIDDLRGSTDLEGRELAVTTNAVADQLAAAAGLLMLKDSGVPAVFAEGFLPEGDGSLQKILRDPATDLFR